MYKQEAAWQASSLLALRLLPERDGGGGLRGIPPPGCQPNSSVRTARRLITGTERIPAMHRQRKKTKCKQRLGNVHFGHANPYKLETVSVMSNAFTNAE